MSAGENGRREAREADVAKAIRLLDGDPIWTPGARWPLPSVDLALPGLYSWRVDTSGASDLSEGLSTSIKPDRIYAGQAGATRWPSGKTGSATLGSRIGLNHFGGRIRSSTFRLTLACALRGSLELTTVGPKKLTAGSEERLTSWMREHLEVAVHGFAERSSLGDLESRVLEILDPPLNLQGRPETPLRHSLGQLRDAFSRATVVDSKQYPCLPELLRMSPSGDRESKITLHDEIVAILIDQNGSMTTQEIASLVNERGNYIKQDGSAVSDFQIHGRTKNYMHLFERDGGRVRLK